MQNNAQTSGGRDPADALKAGHLRTRPAPQADFAKRTGFSDKLANARAFVAQPTD